MSTTTGSTTRRRTALSTGLVLLALLVAAALTWRLAGGDDQASGSAPPTPAAGDPTPGAGDPTSGPEDPAASPPSPGSLDPVPYQEVTPEAAGALTAVADFGTGLSVRATRFEAVRSDASRPGEISAPAVRVTLRAENDSARAIRVATMIVTADHGPDRTPAIAVAKPGGEPFAGELAPGASARGVYLFNVPEEDRGRVRLTLSYTTEAPTLVLAGSVTRAAAALETAGASR